jgi:hypothetical protein
MRRILMISFMLLVAGCATTSRPVVDVPAHKLPSQTEPVAEPQRSAPLVEPALSEPVNPSPVVRKWLSLNDFAEANDEKLLNVYPGMSRQTVERIMDGHQSGTWTNPYKHQAVIGANGTSHEVLFYLTRAPRQGQRVTENLLTPVIFQNERVAAIGRYPLKKIRRAACQSRVKGPCP